MSKKSKNPSKKKSGQKSEKAAERQYIFDNPKNVRRLIWALVAICAATLGLEFFVARYVDHPWEKVFGFYALYGFVMCVFLVLAANVLRKVVMCREDYYDD